MINTQDQLNKLQDTIMGQYYSESLIDKAIRTADYLGDIEAEILFKALKGGNITDTGRMRLQDFVCKLQKRFNLWSQTVNT